jgi:hypothetical protein
MLMALERKAHIGGEGGDSIQKYTTSILRWFVVVKKVFSRVFTHFLVWFTSHNWWEDWRHRLLFCFPLVGQVVVCYFNFYLYICIFGWCLFFVLWSFLFCFSLSPSRLVCFFNKILQGFIINILYFYVGWFILFEKWTNN